MNIRSRGTSVLATLLALAVVCPAWAQSVTDAQNKLLAKRAAEADAFRKLAEAVYGVQITSDTYVRDFITESDQIRSYVDTFVKGVRLGPPRYYEDGVCEVDAEVTVAKLITTLEEAYNAHYKGDDIKITDFQHIKETVQKDVIRATGMGAPRPELPPDLPEGAEEFIEPVPPTYSPPPTIPVPGIWKAVGPQGRLMAIRAARVDAQRQLLERIKGLRLNSNTLVRDFITEYDEIMTQAQGLVIGANEVGRPFLHDDELIAEVTMEVPVEKVITKINELHNSYYRGDEVSSTDIVKLRQTVKRKTFRATGSGVPPHKFVQEARSKGFDIPDWISTRIEAVGEGTDPAIDTAQGKLKARRAAELDAMRKLAEQIYGLRISSTTSVRDFVTEYDEIATQVSGVISGAVTGDPIYTGGVARVTVSIPAADVWRVVHQQMLIIERRG
ncbi:MAG: LPP20 family lipoprotein [Phycisphaerales bacterium]|nr:MAG: LPP20 family lipoprotein [Phycisphaerales bacterium]